MSNRRGRCFRDRRRTERRKVIQAQRRRLEWLRREVLKMGGIGIPGAVYRWSRERLEYEVARRKRRHAPPLSAGLALAAIAAHGLLDEIERAPLTRRK